MNETTYNVRVYKTEIYRGKKVTTYYVRWKVDGQEWREPFRHSGQADSFRSKLVTAAKDGEAFSITTGRPLAWERDEPKEPSISWYTLALDYTAAKWPYAAPNHRRSIAEALIDATEAMFSADSPYPRAEIRRALSLWAFSARLRGDNRAARRHRPRYPMAGIRNHPYGRTRRAGHRRRPRPRHSRPHQQEAERATGRRKYRQP